MTPSGIQDEDLHAQADQLAGTARELYQRGWMDGTSGNLSLRSRDGRSVLITASGNSKGQVTATDTVLVEPDTGAALGPGSDRPSAETAIHLAVYRCMPECGAVVHAHSPYATAVASREAQPREMSSVTFDEFELIKGLGVPNPGRAIVPIFPNWPDVPVIAADVEAHLRGASTDHPPALLLAHHGVTAWGGDLQQARNHLECVEALCHLHLLLR